MSERTDSDIAVTREPGADNGDPLSAESAELVAHVKTLLDPPATVIEQLPSEDMGPKWESALVILNQKKPDLSLIPEAYRAHFPPDLQERYGWISQVLVQALEASRFQPLNGTGKSALREAQSRFASLQVEHENSGGTLTHATLDRLREASGLAKAEAELDVAQRLPNMLRLVVEKQTKKFRTQVEKLAGENLAIWHKRLDKANEELLRDLAAVARKHVGTYAEIGKEAAFWEQFVPTHVFGNPKFNWPDARLTLAGLVKWAIDMLRFRFPEK